ncbi:NAD+ synthase [Natrarchaeobius oligotrophus]|uniref:NH(3)-dependent NAD(+) synthetase n=1 Tax=Natrarchaeobius chitinivorans TaxID=1679083 RepID=A0A3N6M9Z7_NATCH|nr:NAD+ synthase [Natrarchaeobius chitinivorans]RQG97474.1 NAD+ synthase [Natrarchaeobius chitinivorans]
MCVHKRSSVYQNGDNEKRSFRTDRRHLERVRERIAGHLRATVDDAGANGVVVGMSGGIDSTLTATLAVEALGGDSVVGLGMPVHKTERPHAVEARTIAEGLGIEFHEIHLRPLLEAFEEAFTSRFESPADGTRPNERNRALGNAVARLRMLCAYYVSNRQSRLVLGTANRSELLLGYFTKFGDGGVDVNPIGDLYKTEVRALARRVGVPRRIVSKEPTAGFWAGQTDADELGVSYERVDPFLARVVDDCQPIDDAIDGLEIDRETASDVADLVVETAHKRSPPPTPGIDGRSDLGGRFDS